MPDDAVLARIEQELGRLGELNNGCSPDALRDLYALVADLEIVCERRGHQNQAHCRELQKLSALARCGRELWPVYSPELLRLFASAFHSCRAECDRVGEFEKYQI